MSEPIETARASDWSGGTCPFAAGWQKVMMWAFIITDGLLFAGFLASFGFAKLATPNWPPTEEIFHLWFIALMTFVLISSSATMASAVRASSLGDRSGARRYVLLTALGGATFLGMQAYEWSQLIGMGVGLTSNPWDVPLFGQYFFLITGFHGTHVLSGVLILLILTSRLGGKATHTGVEMAGLYWHFVDLVWVFIFTLFYLL